MNFLCLLFTLSILQARTLDFDEIKTHFLEQNQKIKGAKSFQESVEIKSGQLTRSFLPKVHASIGRERFSTGPYNHLSQSYGSAEISINLFNGGKDYLKNENLKSEISRANAYYSIAQMEVLSDTRMHYWEAVYQTEVAQTLVQAIERNDQNLQAAKKRINAGLASPTDTLDFEQFSLYLKQLKERTLVSAKNFEQQIQADLGIEDELILKDKTVPHIHDDELLNNSFNVDDHREIKLLNNEQKIAENEKSIQKRWWTPQINAYSSYSRFTQKERDYPTESDRDDHTVGIELKMNLFDGGNSWYESKSQALKSLSLTQTKIQKQKQLLASYENAKRSLKMTHELVHFAEENVQKAQEYLQRILREYQNGIKNSPDVLQASSRFLDAKVKYAELKRDYQLARVQVLNNLGQ